MFEEVNEITDSQKREKIKELEQQITECESKYGYYKAMQTALKLVINSAYGSFGNQYFILSNAHIANSITKMGRATILYMVNKIENYFYNVWPTDIRNQNIMKETYIAFNDDESKAYMLDIYDQIVEEKEFVTNEDYTAFQLLLKSWGITTERLTSIEHIKKDVMFRGKTITVNVKYKRVLCEFENIINIDGTVISDRDEMEGYKVSFHKQDIVIYGDTDSLYISFYPIMKSCGYTGDGLEFILSMDRLFVKNMYNEWLDDFAKDFKVKSIHDFELERINKSSMHVRKKHYINNIVWEDNIFYDELSYLLPKGVDIVKSSTPPFVRGKKQKGGIWDFVNFLFKHPTNINIRDVLKIVKELKKQYIATNIDEISFKSKVSNYQQMVIDDQNGVSWVKGAHHAVKSSALHNYYLNKNSEFKTKYDLIRGGNVKWFRIKDNPYNDRFAYARSFYPYEIVEKENIQIDYDEMFNLSMLAMINRFGEIVGLPNINKRLGVLNDIIFGASSKKTLTENIQDKKDENPDMEEWEEDDWDF